MIKHVHSSLPYQQVIYQKYNWLVNELPSGYGPLESVIFILQAIGPISHDEKWLCRPVGLKGEEPCDNEDVAYYAGVL